MILTITGLEKELKVRPGHPFVLEIENKTFFTRVCESLISEEGGYAKEPYSLWDDEGVEIKVRDAFLIISDPLHVPWDHRLIAGKMYEKICARLIEDDESRNLFETLGGQLQSAVLSSERCMNSSYTFNVEWDMKKYLKAFGFGPDLTGCESLLDNLIMFLDFLADMNPNKPILFIGCKNFLSQSDVDYLYERLFYQKTTALLLESHQDKVVREIEDKMHVDQCLLGI